MISTKPGTVTVDVDPRLTLHPPSCVGTEVRAGPMFFTRIRCFAFEWHLPMAALSDLTGLSKLPLCPSTPLSESTQMSTKSGAGIVLHLCVQEARSGSAALTVMLDEGLADPIAVVEVSD